MTNSSNSNKINLSSIMSNAWFYFRKNISTSFSECLKASWKAAKTVLALKSGSTTFTFRKANGEIRKAIGTLSSDLFEYTAKGSKTKSNPDTIAYFDLEKTAWRMFRIERLISVQ